MSFQKTMLSMNFNLYGIVFGLISFSIGTEKGIYLPVFSGKLSIFPLNSSI